MVISNVAVAPCFRYIYLIRVEYGEARGKNSIDFLITLLIGQLDASMTKWIQA